MSATRAGIAEYSVRRVDEGWWIEALDPNGALRVQARYRVDPWDGGALDVWTEAGAVATLHVDRTPEGQDVLALVSSGRQMNLELEGTPRVRRAVLSHGMQDLEVLDGSGPLAEPGVVRAWAERSGSDDLLRDPVVAALVVLARDAGLRECAFAAAPWARCLEVGPAEACTTALDLLVEALPTDGLPRALTGATAQAHGMEGDEYGQVFGAGSSCCKHCCLGKACGNSCIHKGYTCHVGAGCACDMCSTCNNDGTCDPGESCPACKDCCTCGTPTTVSLSRSYSGSVGKVRSCFGLFGAGIGAKLKVTGSLTGSLAPCPTCSFSLGWNIAGQVMIAACKSSATFGISYGESASVKACTKCNVGTCEKVCDLSKTCETTKGSGSFNFGLSDWYGFKKSFSGGVFKLVAACGANLGASIAVSVDREDVKNHGGSTCSSCLDCKKLKGHVKFGPKAVAGCGLTIKAWSFKKKFGCSDCGEINLNVDLGFEREGGGDCASKLCVNGAIGVDGKVEACKKFEFGWFKKAVKCSAGAGGSCGGGCSSFSCTPSLSFSCTVQSDC